jgi:excisionase family DNA binding protein
MFDAKTEEHQMSAPTYNVAADALMTPGQVAALFHVDPKTVTRWAHAGRLGSLRTPGGHRRFRETEVMQLLRSLTTEAN